MPFARIARLLANSIAGLIGLACALFLAWLAINLFDVPLVPATRAMLTPPRDPYPADDNLYVAMMGFDAPSGQSMIGAGLSRIETSERMVARLRADPGLAPALLGRPRNDSLEVNVDTKDWQAVMDFPWRGAKAHGNTLAALLKANRQLYRRYLALHGLHGYFETAQPSDHPYLSAYVPPPIQQLFLAETARGIQTGTPAERRAAVTELGRDLRMWRTILDGGGGVVSKMLAAGALSVDFRFLGDMVTDSECDLTFLDGPGRVLLRPFAVGDWKIGDAYRWEMRDQAAMFDALTPDVRFGAPGKDAGPAPWQWLESEWNGVLAQFFKPRATENLAAEQASRLSALADGNPTTFLQRQTAFRKWSRRHVWVHYPTLYNPLGSAILAFVPPAGVYAARVYDVAAFQRLVYLAYLMRKRGIAFNDVAEFMRRHPRWATHPVGGRPFRWDPATGTLAVVRIAPDLAGVPLSLRLVPPAAAGKKASRRPRLCHGPA